MESDVKMQLLLDMQEHPDLFSEEELELLMEDADAGELMAGAALLKQAMTWERADKTGESVHAAWQRFAKTHRPPVRRGREWLKVAASLLAIVVTSAIAFAAIYIQMGGRGVQAPPPGEAVKAVKSKESTMGTNQATDTVGKDTVGCEVVRFEEVSLEKILTDMGLFYRLRVEWRNEEARHLRLFFSWDQRLTAREVVEQLNMFRSFHLELREHTIVVY